MEDHRQDEAKDFWLVQFQRLLDSKPQILIDEVHLYTFLMFVYTNLYQFTKWCTMTDSQTLNCRYSFKI